MLLAFEVQEGLVDTGPKDELTICHFQAKFGATFEQAE